MMHRRSFCRDKERRLEETIPHRAALFHPGNLTKPVLGLNPGGLGIKKDDFHSRIVACYTIVHMIQEDIKAKIKEAMLARDSVRLEVYRGMKAAFTNELIAKGRKPQEELGDEEAMAVITRMSKQRKDSIEQYTAGGRPDLADEEKAQLAIIETFLPELMSREEVDKIVLAKQAELGITDPAKKGMLMAGVMKDLKGKADGMVVKEAVDALF
jgi:uncharacterized protein YqeY